ncbi:hypothetical protein AB833_30185 [Chromatiales bacterium (ex Bugula neritina AB1)]|nr:hypothetical protein AB833_30185 [Chromatiales bacterium (ex Bugula neritina AB1)]
MQEGSPEKGYSEDVLCGEACCSRDIRNLLRAYNLLVATRDEERAIIGKVSRRWLQSESEDWIALSDIPIGVLQTVRGRQVLCDALMPDFDANPESVDLQALLLQLQHSDKLINSNCLSKLEPAIAADLLLGVMLLGVQKYGNRGCGLSILDNDLITAAIVRDTVGCIDRYSAVLPGQCRTVDTGRLRDLFGESVVTHLDVLQNLTARFNRAFIEDSCETLELPSPYATVIAAIEASQLRLVARASGDEILANLKDFQEQEALVAGIRCDGEFPEHAWLALHYRRTQAALSVAGVDYRALWEPLQQTLMTAVDDVLVDPKKRRRLIGRRGKAVHDVHKNLPLVESFNAVENYNSLATVHIAALEMMQYLEKGRRKSACTMLGHSLRIAGVAERLFGEALEPSIATTALLHDVVEDGSRPVAGYDQSLNNIKQRFGGPLAAMVSELTDCESTIAAHQKAEATLRCDSLILPQQQYNFDRFTEMTLEPTATHEPYTLGGIITKIIDTAISEEEGIRDPDTMSGWWRHSGIRIYWSYHVRGRVVRPLLCKLATEIVRHEDGASNQKSRMSDALVAGLRRLLSYSIESADQYAVQNLAIIADEYGLKQQQRAELIRTFFDASIDQEIYRAEVVPVLLDEQKLQQRISSGLVPAENYVTMYTKRAGGNSQADSGTFIKYRAAALQRAAIVTRLELEHGAAGSMFDDIVSLYDYRKAA